MAEGVVAIVTEGIKPLGEFCFGHTRWREHQLHRRVLQIRLAYWARTYGSPPERHNIDTRRRIEQSFNWEGEEKRKRKLRRAYGETKGKLRGASEQAKFLSGVGYQIELAQNELRLIRGFLKDADTRQQDEEQVRNFVMLIRDAAYDLEDVIESFALKVATRRGGGTVKIVLKSYDIRQTSGSESVASAFKRQRDRRLTYGHEVESHIVGLEENTDKLVKELVREGKRHLVVSIWGMGSSEKSTLAKQVFLQNEVKRHFDCFAWLCISQQWEGKDVLEEILIKLTSPTTEKRKEISKMKKDEIAEEVCSIQREKRCLVVLDDIWTLEAWNSIKAGFPINEEIGEDSMHHGDLNHPNGKRRCFFALMAIWKSRKKLRFDNKQPSLMRVFRSVKAWVRFIAPHTPGFVRAILDSKVLSSMGVIPVLKRLNAPRIVLWHPPLIPWLKLNTDGFSKRNPGLAGCGGVFRDSFGRFIGGYCQGLGAQTAFFAELMAVILGGQSLRRRHWRRVSTASSLAHKTGEESPRWLRSSSSARPPPSSSRQEYSFSPISIQGTGPILSLKSETIPGPRLGSTCVLAGPEKKKKRRARHKVGTKRALPLPHETKMHVTRSPAPVALLSAEAGPHARGTVSQSTVERFNGYEMDGQD
ncbi:hypothetical protein ACLB2K_054058 [Fragaria x ananassa]